MRRWLVGIVMAGTLSSGCAIKPVLVPVTLVPDVEAQARQALLGALKDPYSAKVFDLKAGANPGEPGVVDVCGWVNSKNSYGAYAGKSVFWVRIRSGKVEWVKLEDGGTATIWCHVNKLVSA